MDDSGYPPDPANGRWHLDKRIPVFLLLGLFGQAVAFGFWGGMMSARIDKLERTAAERSNFSRELGEMSVIMRENSRRLERLEAKVDDIRTGRRDGGGD